MYAVDHVLNSNFQRVQLALDLQEHNFCVSRKVSVFRDYGFSVFFHYYKQN